MLQHESCKSFEAYVLWHAAVLYSSSHRSELRIRLLPQVQLC